MTSCLIHASVSQNTPSGKHDRKNITEFSANKANYYCYNQERKQLEHMKAKKPVWPSVQGGKYLAFSMHF